MALCCPVPQKARVSPPSEAWEAGNGVIRGAKCLQEGWKSKLRQWWPVLFPKGTCCLLAGGALKWPGRTASHTTPQLTACQATHGLINTVSASGLIAV